MGRHPPDCYLCPSAELTSEDLENWGFVYGSKGNNYAVCWGAWNYEVGTPLAENRSVQHPTYGIVPEKSLRGPFQVNMLRNWRRGYAAVTSGEHEPLGMAKMGNTLGTTIRKITDGTSTTILASEVLGYDSPLDGRGFWMGNNMGSTNFTAKFPPNARPPQCDRIPMCETTSIPRDNPLYCTQNQSDGDVWASARSEHTGGVNAVMCGGSVHFLADQIELPVYHALSTRDGPKDDLSSAAPSLEVSVEIP